MGQEAQVGLVASQRMLVEPYKQMAFKFPEIGVHSGGGVV